MACVLWEAVQHYETSENVLFMTYAGYWLRQAIQRYIENCGSVIRIPTGTKQKIIRYNKTVQKLTQSYGRVPTDKEIQEYMKISAEELENLKKYSKKVSSLDIPLNEDGEATLGDNIQDDCELENHVIDKIYAEQSEKELWNIVECYTEKICEIRYSRFHRGSSNSWKILRNGLKTDRHYTGKCIMAVFLFMTIESSQSVHTIIYLKLYVTEINIQIWINANFYRIRERKLIIIIISEIPNRNTIFGRVYDPVFTHTSRTIFE